jgi:hypothetical protein
MLVRDRKISITKMFFKLALMMRRKIEITMS